MSMMKDLQDLQVSPTATVPQQQQQQQEVIVKPNLPKEAQSTTDMPT